MTILRFLFSVFLVVGLSSCSLLSIKIDSQVEPLTTEELNLRLLSREYAVLFFKEIEEGADGVAEVNVDDDILYSYSLLWKIHAEEGLQAAVYQISPMASLVDSWVFVEQMYQFFSLGEGRDIFAEQQPVAVSVCEGLLSEIQRLAKLSMETSDYSLSKEFVREFVEANPFGDVLFRWTPSYKEWLAYKGLDETEVAVTLGTMPEALGDLSDRLSLLAMQTPKILSWKAELVARNSPINGAQLSQALANINTTSLKFQDFVENNPEYMRNLAIEMGIVLQPILDDLDKKAGEKIELMSKERIALEVMVERERKAIGLMVATERGNVVSDLDAIAQNVVEKAIEQLTVMVSSVMLYLIALVLVVFFAPFTLGFFMGRGFKRRGSKS